MFVFFGWLYPVLTLDLRDGLQRLSAIVNHLLYRPQNNLGVAG
jgi:hypothetical protein